MRIAVIGGGAAGFMAAITAKQSSPKSEVFLFEKSNKLLSKVKVSGGGRCNVTNACFSISELSKKYPRGGAFLKKSFPHFFTKDTIDWFESRGVKLKAENDNRMFPITDNSQTIIDCLLRECENEEVEIKLNNVVKKITKTDVGFILEINDEIIQVERVIIATGGSAKKQGFDWLSDLGLTIVDPVPSLFTFNMPSEKIKNLMGVVAKNTSVSIQGIKQKQYGPLLITHWGMSGPAILKASAWNARELKANSYNFNININWANLSEQEYISIISENKNSNRTISNKNPFDLPNRLWVFLLEKVNISNISTWNSLSKKESNRLLNTLLNDTYEVKGKTTFKEEFVTCGGVSLEEVNPKTLESKLHKGLYFCGEVLNIDGITGGFNFQAAWTTGFLAGKNSVK
jgi:predicted Rossmann fold flavoprotein